LWLPTKESTDYEQLIIPHQKNRLNSIFYKYCFGMTELISFLQFCHDKIWDYLKNSIDLHFEASSYYNCSIMIQSLNYI
jgi:hypothetical protein